MPRYVTITDVHLQDAWFFVIDDGIVVWAQRYCPHYPSEDGSWYNSSYEGMAWSRAKEIFSVSIYLLTEEE